MSANPPYHCPKCPRLVAFLEDLREKEPDWFNGPVPSFGDDDAELLIVGLAPGMKGANRTGRPFTGDYAGDLLYATLIKFGLADGVYDARPDDGVELRRTMITNAVRCLPPQNKPVGAEVAACRPFLLNQMAALPNLKVVLALGRIAHDSFLTTMEERRAAYPFGHNASHKLSSGLHMIDSYHCSRYNTNTKRLTTEMFEDVFRNILGILD